MTEKHFAVAVFLFLLCSLGAEVRIDSGTEVLFDDSRATVSEKTAFRELKNYLGRIFKTEKKARNKIVIGRHRNIEKIFTPQELKALGEEDFLIRSDSCGNIYITGGRPRGTLYGVYHFLDHLLGVHWYLPDFEYVPKYDNLTLPDLNITGKPAFVFRRRPTSFDLFKKNFSVADPAWCARNKLNDTGFAYLSRSKLTVRDLEIYGLPVFYAPPGNCHTMPALFPPQKVFKKHPEWIAMKNGKRVLHKKIQHTGHCLSSKSILEEAINITRKTFKNYPQARYISFSEGDGSGSCTCPPCAALVQKHGGRESALWLNFINQIADAVKAEFPDKMIGTLAYTHTAAPPENMKARDNVLIWLCAWSIWRGYPYDDPRNDKGVQFMKTLEKWTKICKNVHVWDYMTVYSNFYCPIPDLRRNVDSLRAFKKAGANGVLEQGLNIPPWEFGAPFKFWLYARAAWDPEQTDYEKLLETFCKEFYGAPAAPYLLKYYLDMEQRNQEKGFYKIGMGGWQGDAPHASRQNMLKYDALFRTAIAKTGDPVHLDHLQLAYVPVQLTIFRNWKEWSKQGPMPDTLESFYSSLKKIAARKKLEFNEQHVPLLKFLPSFYRMAKLDVTARSSGLYGGSSPYAALDGDENTPVSFGNFSGWLEVEFPSPRKLDDITLVLNKNSLSATYSVLGSTDGKEFFEVIKRQTVSREKHGERFAVNRKISSTAQVKKVRIHIHKMINRHGKNSWTGIYEVYFNQPQKSSER